MVRVGKIVDADLVVTEISPDWTEVEIMSKE
jgi:hypothetical protein